MFRPKAFLLGFNSAGARPELLAEPKAPKNYGPDAARAFVAKERERQANECHLIPIAGTLTEAIIADEKCELLARFRGTKTAEVGIALFDWFEKNLPPENLYAGEGSGGVPMFGFNIRTMLLMGALECLAAKPETRMNYRTWRRATFIHDMPDYLISDEMLKPIGWANFWMFMFGTGSAINSFANFDSDVLLQISTMKLLLDRFQILNPPSPRPTA